MLPAVRSISSAHSACDGTGGGVSGVDRVTRTARPRSRNGSGTCYRHVALFVHPGGGFDDRHAFGSGPDHTTPEPVGGTSTRPKNPRTAAAKASASSTWLMCELCSKTTCRAPARPRRIGPTTAGVASSCRPEVAAGCRRVTGGRDRRSRGRRGRRAPRSSACQPRAAEARATADGRAALRRPPADDRLLKSVGGPGRRPVLMIPPFGLDRNRITGRSFMAAPDGNGATPDRQGNGGPPRPRPSGPRRSAAASTPSPSRTARQRPGRRAGEQGGRKKGGRRASRATTRRATTSPRTGGRSGSGRC